MSRTHSKQSLVLSVRCKDPQHTTCAYTYGAKDVLTQHVQKGNKVLAYPYGTPVSVGY